MSKAAPPHEIIFVKPHPRPAPRVAQAINLAIFLIAVIVVAIAVNFFAQRDGLRLRLDATKTRAYSLSPQTRQLLANLRGEWKIALIVSAERIDRSMRRQIDEVLGRYTDAAPNITLLRIDPADPQTLADYEALLSNLQSVYREEIALYETALDEGAAAFGELILFAQQQSGVLEAVLARVPADDPARLSLQPRGGVLALLAQEGQLVLDEVAKARAVDASRPLPDYDTARSILAEALSQWALELDELATIFAGWLERSPDDPAVRQFASSARQPYTELAQRLALAGDPLERLPALELSAIGTQLAQGEAAVIVGPDKAAVIPSSQLFPKSNLAATREGGVTFDQRFRGEQLISAGLRALTVKSMPRVVFVHAEEGSLFIRRPQQADLVGVAQVLRASRYDVAEWAVNGGQELPRAAEGQAIVWVIVPAPQRQSLQVSPAEQRLLSATQRLIDEGESVLISVYPSQLPRYGQPDPWANIADAFGLRVETAAVVIEAAAGADGAGGGAVERGQAIRDFADEHIIARAVDGQQAYFALPMAVRSVAALPPDVRVATIASIAPDERRWLDPDWALDQTGEPEASMRLTSPVPVVAAAERFAPGAQGAAPQRLVLVASGGWMLSYIADLVISVGGGRVALVNPGNYELMLASVAWLAGMDDLIAAGPMSQEIARLRDLTPRAMARWRWITVGAWPAMFLALAVIVWVVRRR